MVEHMMLFHADSAITLRQAINSHISEDGEKIYAPKTYQTYFLVTSKMGSLNPYSGMSGIKSTIVPENYGMYRRPMKYGIIM